MRSLFIVVFALALVGCTTAQLNSAAYDAESADVAALTLYAATGSVLDGLEAIAKSKGQPITQYEAIRSKAWDDLMVVNAAYHAGQVISLTALQADKAAAQSAGN